MLKLIHLKNYIQKYMKKLEKNPDRPKKEKKEVK